MAAFTIVGAGAIGSIVGVSLARAGHDIRFVESNPDHVAAVRESGLKLTGHTEGLIRPDIMTPDEVREPLDKVLLAVKSGATESAMETIAPWLSPNGYVVSLQNGLEEYRIARHVGEARTIGAFLTFGGHYRAPGEVVYGGPGTFRVGEIDGQTTPRVTALAEALSAVQPAEATNNIFGYLWAKTALGAIYFATALADADVTDLYAVPRYREMFGKLAGEVIAVAEASGVKVEAFDGFDPKVFRPGQQVDPVAVEATWAGQMRYWTRHSGRRTGIWRDLAIHKRRTEVQRLVASVIDVAAPLGMAVPRVQLVVDLVQQIELGQRTQTEFNLEVLLSLGSPTQHATLST